MKEAMAEFSANALMWHMQEGRKVNMSSAQKKKKKTRKGCRMEHISWCFRLKDSEGETAVRCQTELLALTWQEWKKAKTGSFRSMYLNAFDSNHTMLKFCHCTLKKQQCQQYVSL